MKRLVGLDFARGLACVFMIQTHAFDAYVDAPYRASPAFSATRFLALLPLPLFLVLAGMGVSMRLQRARSQPREGDAEREREASLRRELVRRGAGVLAMGYALNILYGLMDGAQGLTTWLRADVLQAIGLSIVVLGLVLPARPRSGVLLALFFLLPSPWLNEAAGALGGGAAGGGVTRSPAWVALEVLLAPFVDVAPYTQMPLFPLGFWAALGLLTLRPLREHPLRLGLVALLVAGLSFSGMEYLISRGVPLSRRHPIVWLNAFDLGARALVVIAFSTHLAHRVDVERAWARPLVTLGQGSLFVYALHLPFAYGALGSTLRARELTTAQALPYVTGLILLTYLALVAKNRITARMNT